MDLFHVETGSVPGQSCSEETMPILKRSTIDTSSKDEPTLTSKAFLINESLTCIANLTVTFPNPSDKKGSCIKPISSVKQRDSEANPPKSREYRCLSPKNLEDPLFPNSKSNVSAIADDSGRELLLEKTNNNVLNKSENKIELKQSSTVLALAALEPDQPSTSSAHKGASPPDSGKKKTLEELAKEWNSSQSPEQTKAEETKMNNAVTENAHHDDDEVLVRHSTYYSTSSSVHGMSSHECRLRNKLKARRYLNHNEVYQEKKKPGSPPLVKLHAIATE